MADQLLEIVNEADEVIGTELRSVIHANGLRHREVHVWLLTPDNHVVLQRRSATKDSYPGYLDASVGGHAEPGQTYEQAALMELEEETGLTIQASQLIPVHKVNITQPLMPGSTQKNVVFRMVYTLPWQGRLNDLKVEAQDGAGFESIPLSHIFSLSFDDPGELVPGLLAPAYGPVWQKLAERLK